MQQKHLAYLNVMGKKYAIRDKEAMYFISFSTVGWVDVFSRKEYRDILIQNLKYCQEAKGLIIYSWCIMSNHVHLVAQASNSNLSDILRDFKSYTAKVLLNAIHELPESRRKWMLRLFREEGERNSNNIPPSVFGDKTTSTKRYTAKSLLFKSLITFITTPLKPV